MDIEEVIGRLEDSLRRLKVQWEMFFAGSLKRPPYDLKREVEQMILTHSNTHIRNYAHRFQFNTLVSKYSALQALWAKQLRAREEGRTPGPIVHHEPRAPLPPPPKPSGEEVVFSVRVSDPASETDVMRALFERYVEARGLTDAQVPRLKLETFVQQVAKQASSLREASGCSSIEFRVLKVGDSVSLRARADSPESKS